MAEVFLVTLPSGDFYWMSLMINWHRSRYWLVSVKMRFGLSGWQQGALSISRVQMFDAALSNNCREFCAVNLTVWLTQGISQRNNIQFININSFLPLFGLHNSLHWPRIVDLMDWLIKYLHVNIGSWLYCINTMVVDVKIPCVSMLSIGMVLTIHSNRSLSFLGKVLPDHTI